MFGMGSQSTLRDFSTLRIVEYVELGIFVEASTMLIGLSLLVCFTITQRLGHYASAIRGLR
jgi:hypothetical protein